MFSGTYYSIIDLALLATSEWPMGRVHVNYGEYTHH